jgi:DNA-binding SARP family transcriptional activator
MEVDERNRGRHHGVNVAVGESLMAHLTARLFGRFEVCCGDQPTSALNARRARELFCYLVLHRDQPQRRETLAGLLWEDAAPEQARKYLRQALWQVQTGLHLLADADGVQPLEVDPEWIQLKSCDQMEVDVARFDEAARSCHGIPGPQLDPAARQRLEEAVCLYRGDLLEGWFQDWCLFERERLQNDFLDTLEKLVCSCESRCDSEHGLALARRMLALDPAREQVHCHVMRLHVLAGNRTQALREFQRCEQILMQELAVKPSQQTCALYESIRDGNVDSAWLAPGSSGGSSMAPGFAPNQLPALADMLKRVQHLFERIETRMGEGIAGSSAPSGKSD